MFDSMPRSALRLAGADHVVPVSEIAPLLAELSQGGGARHADRGRKEAEKGVLTELVCPECNGVLWEIVDGTVQYRCHVGHAYTPESLRISHAEEVERALWAALSRVGGPVGDPDTRRGPA
jgi:two-component system chemotaxis response regulator CheB